MNALNNTFVRLLAVSFVILTVYIGSSLVETANRNDNVPAVLPAHEFPASDDAIAPVKYELVINNDNGTPRAREDVILFKTAVSGIGGAAPAYAPGPAAPVDHNTQSQEDHRLEISGRWTDAKTQAFLARTSLQQLMAIYQDASNLIDTRHVNPPSYEDRTRGAVQSLMLALENPEFLRANNVNPQAQAIQNVQNQLWQLATSQPARTQNEALGVMQYAMDIVNRNLGVRREAVALEFVNGTIDALDKYSAFLPEVPGYAPGANVDGLRTAGLEENIVGIGVELKTHAQGVEVVGVVENAPAAKLGLREGDIIVAVNNQSIAGQTLNAAADRLAGQAGTSVSLEIVRNGQRFRGTVVRQKFYVSSVTGTKLIDAQNKVGYIRMKQFSESTAEDLEKAMFSLHNQGMQSLVLDLRGNPGGLLDECIDISDMFLPSGTIVSTRGRNQSDNTQSVAKQPKTWKVPLVVLVDDNSASASEIFAAAIQDNYRGIVVGRKSYGKGTVQTHFPMQRTGGTLKLTTAKFYSPSGREMAGYGVTPDVAVNVQTTGYRGSENDADVRMALQVIGQGVPAQMAANPGKVRPNVNTNIGQNADPFQLPLPASNVNYQPAVQVPAGLTEY